MDKSEAARCLAKIQAYLACGKDTEAKVWADRLRAMLTGVGL